MKHLCVILLALVLVAGMSYAQVNESIIVQTGYDNTADVEQVGSGNASIIHQLAGEFFPRGMSAEVTQTGLLNLSNVDMKEWGEHTAYVTQTGFANVALVKHERNNGHSDVIQQGELNQVDLRVHAIGSGVVEAYQYGNGNMTLQDMGALGSIAGAGNEFEITQIGNTNKAQQTMFGTPGDYISPLSNNSSMEIRQEGNDNMAVEILGDGTMVTAGNLGKITQYGDSHQALLVQVGENNDAFVTQYIGGQISNTMQKGVGNLAVVSQSPF